MLTLRALLPSDMEFLGPDHPVPIEFRADSRKVEPGDGFVAFPGIETDGHRFIELALNAGASVIMAESGRFDRTLAELWPDRTFVLSPGPCETALAVVARNRLDRMTALRDLVAVTGSVGKTTTRRFLAHIMAAQRPTATPSGNLNTLIGCAMAVLVAPEETECLVLEMGANHPGEIAQMVDYFPPTLAAITEVAPAHLEGFGSIEGVRRAKWEIFTSGHLRGALVNADNPMLLEAASDLTVPVTTFGRHGDLAFDEGRLVWEEGYRIDTRIHWQGESRELSARLSGCQGLYPLSCALAMALRLGLTLDQALAGAAACVSFPGRGQVVRLASGAWLIDESYNASPKAMEAALAALKAVHPGGRRCAVLGAMGEMGEASLAAHQRLYDDLSSAGLDWWRIYGAIWEPALDDQSHWLASWDALERAVDELGLKVGDVLLVKGSFSNGLGRLVQEMETRKP